MPDYIEDLADAEEVEINAKGEIVAIGTISKKDKTGGIRPPKHTFL